MQQDNNKKLKLRFKIENNSIKTSQADFHNKDNISKHLYDNKTKAFEQFCNNVKSKVITHQSKNTNRSRKDTPPPYNSKSKKKNDKHHFFIRCLKQLQAIYPSVFPKSHRLPLASNIRGSIANTLNIPNKVANKFLFWYTHSSKYIANFTSGKLRINLNGEYSTRVTNSEVEFKNSICKQLYKS